MPTDTRTLSVEDMSCNHCTQRVKDALEEIEGVAEADVDLDAAEATISVTEEVSHGRLAEAVEDAGYHVPASA